MRQKVLRWVEPLFPVLVVAAGVMLAPALFMTGTGDDTPSVADTAKLAERFVGHPILVQDEYQGCNVDGHAYSARVIPSWRCGKETFVLEPVRDIASLPTAEVIR